MTTKSSLVDFHCHLDLYPDHEGIVRDTEEAGVYTLAVTTTPKAWERNHELTRTTKHVRAALGLHPQLVAERADELSIWEKYLNETRYVGEVGLDAGPRHYKTLDLQKQIFQKILKCCATSGDKIISVHSIRASKAVLDHIEVYLPLGRGKIVLHWFTGSKSEAQRAIDMGCYFSINMAMFDNPRHTPLLDSIPLDRLLTETDGPFTKNVDRPTKPADVSLVVDRLGQMKGLSVKTMAKQIKDNLRNLTSF